MIEMMRTPLALRGELEDFYGCYGALIDDKQMNDWVDLFADDGLYAVGTNNNVSTTGMWWYVDRGHVNLKERAAFAGGYFWHAPSRMLHMITNVRGQENEDGTVSARAALAVFAADRTDASQLHVAGRYEDVFVRRDGQLFFKEHRVIIDAETVPSNMGILL